MIKAKRKMLSLFLLLLLCLSCVPARSVHAQGFSKRAWIRAKITYEFDEGVSGLTDDVIDFADEEDWEKRSDGWYYYKDEVHSGDRIRFIDGVNVPTEWTNDLINKKFRIIVTVEASEVPVGEGGFDNSSANYKESFEVWGLGYENQDDLERISKGRMKVTIHEYELNENGQKVDYQNDKLIVPGQKISKIVEFELNATTLAEDIATGDIFWAIPVFVILAGLGAAVLMIYIIKRKKGGVPS